MEEQSAEFNTVHLDSIGTYVDAGLANLIDYLNKNECKTSYSCSGLYKDHFTEKQLQEIHNSNEEPPGQDTYIRFQPDFHTPNEEGKIIVDEQYYILKSKLQHKPKLRVYDKNKMEIVVLEMEFYQRGNPYSRSQRHRYVLEPHYDSVVELMNCVDDLQLYDRVIETLFQLLQSRCQYPEIFFNADLRLDLSSNKDVQVQLLNLPELPSQFDRDKFDITEDNKSYSKTAQVRNKEVGVEDPTLYEIIGSLEDIRTEFGEKQSEEYFKQIHKYKLIDNDLLDSIRNVSDTE